MVGHESRRPAAKPRLGIGAPRVGVESACPWPASTRAATVPPVRTPWYPTSAPGCLATAPRVTFRLVATMATMATPRGPTPKKKSHAGYPLVGYHPFHLSHYFFSSFQCRGGHGGHGGHDTRTAPETRRAAASARGRRVQALRCARRAQRAWDGDSRTREASSHAWRPPVMDEPHYPTGVPHVGARMSRYGT